MEPADLNPFPNANDDVRLEALLRDAVSALPDDGFSSRVLAALPPEETAAGSWRRTAFCFAGAAAGCGYALWRGVNWPELQAEFGRTTTALADPLFMGALVVAALSLLFAFRAELREKLLP